MITYDIPMHGAITIEERKQPKCCSETCCNFEQTDTLIPRGGRCKSITKGGAKAVVFEGDECLLGAMNQDAA